MSAAPAPAPAPAPPASGGAPSPLDFKADARNSRLRLSNTLQEKIFSEWQKLAVKTCDAAVRAYWVCRQEQGLLVVLNCRGENERMQLCVSAATRDEAGLAAYRASRMTELATEQARRRSEAAAAAAASAGAAAPR